MIQSNKKRRYTPEEVAVLEEHHDRMLQGCENALRKLRKVPKPRPDFVEANIKYWVNARAGIRWSRSRIAPNTRIPPGGDSATV